MSRAITTATRGSPTGDVGGMYLEDVVSNVRISFLIDNLTLLHLQSGCGSRIRHLGEV